MVDVDDRWFTTDRATGAKVPTGRHGTGKRWIARWRDGERQRSRAFERKADAERFVAGVSTDLDRGTFIDPADKTTVRAYGDAWLAMQTSDPSTREAVERRLRLYVYPTLGDRQVRALRPSEIRAWLSGLQGRLQPSTIRVAFANLSAMLSAAVDDRLIPRNECQARSVKPPAPDRRKVEPWTAAEVTALLEELPGVYRAAGVLAAGLGLRQGEALGLAGDDVDYLRKVVHVRRQVKVIGGALVFAPPKGGKTRDVPLPEGVALELAAHVKTYPPVPVTLPWGTPDGKLTTARLLLDRDGEAVPRSWFNLRIWGPAVKAAGIVRAHDTGMHGLRHTYASALLEDGVSIKAVAEYLGHADAGFTLRTYAHLMPSTEGRARRAVDTFFNPSAPDVRQEA